MRAITHPNKGSFDRKFEQVHQTLPPEYWDFEVHPNTHDRDLLIVRDPKTGYIVEVHTWAPVT